MTYYYFDLIIYVVIGTMSRLLLYFFFFFQAEDGIRDLTVTGVQTCALPISLGEDIDMLRATARGCARGDLSPSEAARRGAQHVDILAKSEAQSRQLDRRRSEERRVGKECRSRWSPDH